MNNYAQFEITKPWKNGETMVTFWLDTKRHIWRVWFNDLSNPITEKYENPDMEFTKAKGDSVIKFLEALKEKRVIE